MDINKKLEQLKLLEPGIFSGEIVEDPERWLKKFEIFYKNKDWTDVELIEIAEVHFEGPARAWFEVYGSEFKTWDSFKTEFGTKFSDKQKEILAWKELVKFEPEKTTVLELAAKLNKLFRITKVTNDREKVKHLLNKIEIRYHKVVVKCLEKPWDEIIKKLVNEEETWKTLGNKVDVKTSEENLVKKIPIPEPSKDSGMYESLIKRFDQLKINLVELKEEVRTIKQYERFVKDSKWDKICNHCKRKGHDERSCFFKSDDKKSVGLIELSDKSDETFTIKRSNEEVRLEALKKHKNNEESAELKLNNTKVRLRNNNSIRFISDSERYSIKKDLGERNVEMTFSQLLEASPSIRSELMELCKKQKIKEINNWENLSEDITNCRALIKIGDSTFWVIIDTGAACSIKAINK
ncbi:hypothetical protein AYI69_g8372 [Smittium culicis]|uniref:Retrotransposon gag domain-containing protein n=2 Tax=Smittium culicis TaxID=133412 RepID=A0A1R1XK14_9FUNG|nr:hypothetical protein AYI69_g8372 [Smittium culicis]